MANTLSRKALYLQIADILRDEIASKEPGERMASDDALTKRFEVSLGTIRDSMMLLTSDGLIERRHGSGTFVAEPKKENSRSTKEKHVAVLIDRDISHPQLSYFHRRVAQQLPLLIEEQGLSAQLYTGRHLPWEDTKEPTCDSFLKAVDADQIQGVIAQGTSPHTTWMKPLQERQVPIVGNEHYSFGVANDHKKMVNEAVQYLVNHKRSKIALLAYHDKWRSAGQTVSSRKLFEDALHQYGIKLSPQWIRDDLPPSRRGSGWAEMREVWSASMDRPDGLIVCDDMLFPGAAMALLEMGVQVSDQLMVTAQTNKGSGMIYPFPLARAECDPDAFALARANLLIDLINGKEVDTTPAYIPFQWLDADSTPKYDAEEKEEVVSYQDSCQKKNSFAGCSGEVLIS